MKKLSSSAVRFDVVVEDDEELEFAGVVVPPDEVEWVTDVTSVVSKKCAKRSESVVVFLAVGNSFVGVSKE